LHRATVRLKEVDMLRFRHRIAPAIALTVVLAAAAPAVARPQLNSLASTASTPAPGGYILAEKTVATAGASDPTVATAAGPRSEVVSGHGYVNPAAPATVVRTVAPSDGFDWGDAGVGAAGALVLMLVISGGVLGVTNARRHAARSTA
jgi:hypothetical protein